ncbi:MAG: hypothetical protein ACYTG7_08435 [Planctomycetota bacterium]|jgi:hypothetical protein
MEMGKKSKFRAKSGEATNRLKRLDPAVILAETAQQKVEIMAPGLQISAIMI